jgi:hypothetical protein
LHTSGENPKTADRTRIKMVYIKLKKKYSMASLTNLQTINKKEYGTFWE